MTELKIVYGSYFSDFLTSLGRPNPRLYLRLNTLRWDEIHEADLSIFNRDEDFEEAIYVNVIGPTKLEEYSSRIIVDKKTAESAIIGSNVYQPGIKKIEGNGPIYSIFSENGVHVANGKLRAESEILVENVESIYRSVKISELDVIKKGLAISQGKSSMYVARMLDPRPAETIVDMNAYPGGKLTHIYQLEPRAKIIGFDHTNKKVQKLREVLVALRMKVPVVVGDSRYLYEDFNIREVDKVLIDPPCSAIGVRPKIYDRKTIGEIKNFQIYQKQFLNSAFKILKKKGVVIYSTCTVTLKENEEVVSDPRFEIERIVRFHPNLHETTGFFIAKLVKR
ncbi:RsmB/NOP family class I SAM-dependent RNA methyltransferase [Metallosphaera tengchongensis]|uniref:tRNA (cytosine(72)-C(5))-methyltransferase n=1 Tax=Metallosphaera tengchongensis TaxID=1532350 RepID=A0A6N0P000_9CREN|nr:RsmB/NOP family class I SAM-dependent RNA methyltransferase [Metallosphaera tengchongensis]